MDFIKAKCPGCGANLDLEPNSNVIKCKYCKQTIIIDDKAPSIEKIIKVDGIQTNKDLIESANTLLKMNDYLKSKKLFLEFTEKNPTDYQGWIGLLIARTRNFEIKDANILFEKDVEKYHKNFLNTATNDAREYYEPVIDRYLYPSKYLKIEKKEIKNKNEKVKVKKTCNFNIITEIFNLLISVYFLLFLCCLYPFIYLIPKLRYKFGYKIKKIVYSFLDLIKVEHKELETYKETLETKNSKFKSYIAPIIVLVCSLAFVSFNIWPINLAFLALFISTLPQVRKILKKNKIKSWIVYVVLFFVLIFTLSKDYKPFEGSYLNEDSNIILEVNFSYLYLTYDEINIEGSIEYYEENSVYYITLLDDNSYLFEYDTTTNTMVYINSEEEKVILIAE